MKNGEIVDRYTDISSTYNRRISLTNTFILKRLRKKLINKSKGKILEIAAGSGANFPYYSKSQNITCIDLTPAMLKLAKKEAEKISLKVKLKIADAENLPFKSNSFNTVIETLGLCTYNDPVKALKEMKRVCKKNGRILLLEHGKSKNRFISKLQSFKEKYLFKKKCCKLTRDHCDLVEESGLKILKAERKFFGVIYFIVARP